MGQITAEVIAERKRIIRRLENEADGLTKAGLDWPESKVTFLGAAWALKRQAGILRKEIKVVEGDGNAQKD